VSVRVPLTETGSGWHTPVPDTHPAAQFRDIEQVKRDAAEREAVGA
jgi:hypothetical protein